MSNAVHAAYAALGVPPSASNEEVKIAYRKLLVRTHPDKGGSAAEFQTVKEAYALLAKVWANVVV